MENNSKKRYIETLKHFIISEHSLRQFTKILYFTFKQIVYSVESTVTIL